MYEQTFEPKNQNITELFSCPEIYKIPDYQRQYSWTDEQLDQLWEDLLDAYENRSENDCYFLGSIVVVDNKQGCHELIDGQQRITTLMILMNVLIRNFPNINKTYENPHDPNGVYCANHDRINMCIKAGNGIRLMLQSHPNYDASFKNIIVNCKDFSKVKKPTKKELKIDDPSYKYQNTAHFFYHRLKELGDDILGDFANFLFFRVDIIKIVCHDESFAIKLFQVMNDRGLDLSSSDLIKTHLYSEYNKLGIEPQLFESKWKEIETIISDYDLKMDDYMACYLYYRLKSNPRHQLSDEFKKIIDKDSNPDNTLDDMVAFAKAVKLVYESKNTSILSLRYIPWRTFVITALATAFKNNYREDDRNLLFSRMQRFYYLTLISGSTLNTIKQTSFTLIGKIAGNAQIADIESLFSTLIKSKKMIRRVYDALDDDVYEEKFLKPLLLSVDYRLTEPIGLSFIPMDINIHIDHIIPRKYKNNQEEWRYLKEESKNVDDAMNTLGNMALLYSRKNEEARNFGMKTKLQIYSGKDNMNTGATSFQTTREVVEVARHDIKPFWNTNRIKARKTWLIGLIEEMLDISRDDIEESISAEVEWTDTLEGQIDNGANGIPQRGAITSEMKNAVFNCVCKILESNGKYDEKEAISELKRDYGMNENSSKIYIGFCIGLANGRSYNRMVATDAAQQYYNRFKSEFNGKYFENARKAMIETIEYRKKIGMNSSDLEEIIR